MITVQWSDPVSISSYGHVFYRRFCCGDLSKTRVYLTNDFVLFTPPLSSTVYVAEILSAWRTKIRNFVSLRIYARPQDTNYGRLSSHGDDELLVLSKFIVLTCEQLFRYECVGDVWSYGSLLHTKAHSRQDQEPNGLVCTEKMLPIDTEDVNFGLEITQPKSRAIICDFHSYCRYKALMKRIGDNPSVLDPTMFTALGGVLSKWPNTFLAFCCKAFYDSQLEVLLSCEGLMIRASVIKGVPPIERNCSNQSSVLKRGPSEDRDQTWEPPLKKAFSQENPHTARMSSCMVDCDHEDMCDAEKKHNYRKQQQQAPHVITINTPTSTTNDDCTTPDHAAPSILVPTYNFSLQEKNIDDNFMIAATVGMKPSSAVPTSDYLESCMLKSHLIQETEYSNKMTETRREFFESLFTFMMGRNTPITRIPLLGFKKLDLYELFHLTNQLGGYEQVTLSNKWKSVFNALGGREITAAATYTRKHYEKYLLAYEKEVHCGK